MSFAEFRVSTRPAALTAVTRVESSGLFEAAVATGSCAIPLKLPAPEAGTAAQAVPNGASAAAGVAGAEEAGALEEEAEPDLVLLEQAARLIARAPVTISVPILVVRDRVADMVDRS
ncbi:hypothetical protein GCM10009760_31750 [Kitasatospora kazusensis]|uniref:Uncharacterized protein n=1 Tax=Kitasatospora kazusensis TaxID=407974 RepID=A0ABP5LAV9_9ACTN